MTHYELAKAEIGTVEWKDGSNPKVVAYYRDAGHAEVKDDATAWCAAFVGAMLHRAGMKGTGSLAARSYLKWGTPVDRKNAREGDVVVFKRGNSTWQGHVAFFVRDNGSTITVLGGNQADAVNRRAYPAASLLGIRRASQEWEVVSDISDGASGKPVPREVVANWEKGPGFWASLWTALLGIAKGR